MRAPSYQQIWTDRDVDIIRTLALRVRMMTLRQIGKIWWGETTFNSINARRRLTQLCDAGLLSRYPIQVHPLLAMDAPVIAWKPSETPTYYSDPAKPDSEKVAYQLQKRWTKPVVSKTVFIATKLTCGLFRSYAKGGLGKPFDWTHDLHMAQIYRYYQLQRPEEFPYWVGEDQIGKAEEQFTKDPDAFIIKDGELTRIVEFGGSYNAKKVSDFHDHCSVLRVPYEIW